MLNFKSSQHPELIQLTSVCRATMLNHCFRKLGGKNYLDGEDQDRKAFGLLGGRVNERVIEISSCYPLLRNARQSDTHKVYMDEMMLIHATPSETPLTERGWVADSKELTGVLKSCRELDLVLAGTYHMHRVAWPNDRIRDTPTTLDEILGSGSRLLMFIISMVDPSAPLLRAFYEGSLDYELPIHYI